MSSFDLELHDGQCEVFEDYRKVRAMCAGRRFGKSYLDLAEILVNTLEFPRKVDRFRPEVTLATLPTLQQAKPILWKPLLEIVESSDLNKHVDYINRTDFAIKFSGKPEIRLAGTNDNNGNRLRGNRIWFFCGDEWQDTKPTVLKEVIIPAMADTPGSRALLTFTPKGKLNHTYNLYQMSQTEPDTYGFFSMPSYRNPKIKTAEIERLRRVLPPRLFKQEVEADFTTFEGQFYPELDESNFTTDSYFDLDLVVLGVDWGDIHPAVAVVGRSGDSWFFLEGWHGNTGAAIPTPIFESHIVRLATKYNPAIVLCDPSKPSAILALRALGVEHNLTGLARAVAGYNRVIEGIYQVSSLIYQRKLLFPITSSAPDIPGAVTPLQAYEELQAYHRKIDNKTGQPTEAVEDGQQDHIADCIRYALATERGIT